MLIFDPRSPVLNPACRIWAVARVYRPGCTPEIKSGIVSFLRVRRVDRGVTIAIPKRIFDESNIGGLIAGAKLIWFET